MTNKFSVFYNTEVKIFEMNGVSSYSSEAETVYKKTIFADFQPYSSWKSIYGMNDREFSLISQRRMRIFFNNEDMEFVKMGNYAEAEGIMYRVEYVEKRRMGAMAVLKEIMD